MLIDRRDFLTLLSSHIAIAGACCSSAAARGGASSACMVSEVKFQRAAFLRASIPNTLQVVRSFQGEILSGSGNTTFDVALGSQVLVPLAREFGVNPGFGYYEEAHHLEYGDENALASTLTRVADTRGTIVLGLNLLNKFLAIPGGDFAVMAICAHEFAHIKQYGLDVKRAIENGLPPYCIELHADFLAGYFVRIFSERVPQTRLQVIGEQWSKLGHPTNTGSHGTSAQRIKAIEAGFEFAKRASSRNVDAASSAGYQHVSQYRI